MKFRDYLSKHKYIFCFSILLIGYALFMSGLFQLESDYFWHIKAGENIFENGNILTSDIFSWFMRGKYWVSHEWGFDLLIYILKLMFGEWHLFIYPFITIGTLLIVLFFTNSEKWQKNIIFSLAWLMGFLIFVVYVQARPHLLSFIFLALTIYFCYDLFCNPQSKKIYFLPLVTLFWTNFHGGSSNLSYLFCLGFLFIGLFKFSASKVEAKRLKKEQLIRYAIVAVICVVAICINPHGLKMVLYPYVNITDSVMLNFISEWRPTVLSDVTHYPYFLLIMVCGLILLLGRRKIDFIDLALFGVSLILGLKSIRFWGYTYIIMSYVVFKYIPKRKADYGTGKALIFLGIIFSGIFIWNVPNMLQEYDDRKISSNMLSMIKKSSPKRLFNMYDYGGELIYNDIEVFVDGRADLYSKYNLVDYKTICDLGNGYKELINEYKFDYFLVDDNYPIDSYLEESSNFQLLYSENDIKFYKRKDLV